MCIIVWPALHFVWGADLFCFIYLVVLPVPLVLQGQFKNYAPFPHFLTHLSANVCADHTRHVIEKQNSTNMGNHDGSDSDSSDSDSSDSDSSDSDGDN